MSNTKNYALTITKGYTSALEKLKKKYDAGRALVEEEYQARNKKIKTDTQNHKNELSANYKMALENANNAFAEKGIASSGTAVSGEIATNLSKSRALSELNAKMNESLNDSRIERQRRLSELESDNEKGEREVYQNMIDDMINAEKLDREYAYKTAQSDEDKRRWEIENERKNLESDRDYELQEKKYLKSVEDSENDRALAEKKYQLDAYKAYNSNTKVENSTSKSGSAAQEDDDRTPNYKPDEFVKAMYTAVMRQDYKYDWQRKNALEKAIRQVLLDTSIAASFKRDVRVYASAMGYI